MAVVKSELSRLQKEIGLLTDLLENDEENSALLNERGKKFINLNEKANEYFDKTGLSDFLGNHLASAMQDFDDALAYSVEGKLMASIRTNYGDALASCGKFDAAVQHYDKALAIDPCFTFTRLNREECLAKHSRYS